jgi:rare lipoprotein A
MRATTGRAAIAAMTLAPILVLGACTNGTEPGKSTASAPVQQRGYYKVGNPYEVEGVRYVPREDYGYDETGVGSWYGPGFHAKYTANGEVYDQNEVTAAHKTLPLPSLVRITNLENGRQLVVRVNDRGPFVAGRIIDLSKRSAQLLGVEKVGTAKVRVQILAKESQTIKEAALQGKPAAMVVAQAPEPPPVVEPGGRNVERTPLPPPLSEPVVAAAPAVDEKTLLAQASPGSATVAQGTTIGGRFLPAAAVKQTAPKKTQLFIQAGAFGVLDNAERLRQQLTKVGHADVSQVQVGGRTFYRVRIGPLASVDQADAALAKVVTAGAGEAKIVAE